MTDVMTSSQVESHFSRKRSRDDVDHDQMMDSTASATGRSSLDVDMMGGNAMSTTPLRGSEDNETYSQEGLRTNEEKSGQAQRQEVAMVNGHQTGGESSRIDSAALPIPTSDSLQQPPPKKTRILPPGSDLKAQKEKLAADEKLQKITEKEAEKSRIAIQKSMEKEAERLRKQQEKQAEREAAAQQKAADKAAEKTAKEAAKLAEKQAEKDAKDAAKEAERVVKEAEKAEKEAEKAAKARERREKDDEKQAEKAKKEADRARKESEKKQKEESKKKAERSQMRLGNFFASTTTPKDETKGSKTLLQNATRASMSPAPSIASESGTPSKSKATAYESMFPEFFVHKDVTVAPLSRYTFDEAATDIISTRIDKCILNETPTQPLAPFDARSLLHLDLPIERGKKFMAVREIMDELTGNSKKPIDLTTESQHSQLRRSKDLLSRIPLKHLKFYEDIRPPYIGTYTSRPINGTAKLARKPFSRELPDQNYDYDSEAEWQEDDEDAEDLGSEKDEDEEPEDGDDMAEFLDDENDELATSRRQVIQGDLEHTSTGLCWEDKHKKTSNVKLMPYRMEIMIGSKPKCIDPLSTEYWDEPKTMAPPPRVPLSSASTNSKAPTLKSFFSANSDDQSSSTIPSKSDAKSDIKADPRAQPEKMVRDEDMAEFRTAIQGNQLTQVGIVDFLAKKFPKNTAKVVKATLMYVAHRGKGKTGVWELY